MISIYHAGVIYLASLTGCYDGDTCKVTFLNFPPLVAEQSVRFAGFDTPEMRGGCKLSKHLAQKAQSVTQSYMQGNVWLEYIEGPEKFGRLLVRAPELQRQLIAQGLAKPSPDGKRQNWCG